MLVCYIFTFLGKQAKLFDACLLFTYHTLIVAVILDALPGEFDVFRIEIATSKRATQAPRYYGSCAAAHERVEHNSGARF